MTWKPFRPPTDVELVADPTLQDLPCVAVVLRDLAMWAA